MLGSFRGAGRQNLLGQIQNSHLVVLSYTNSQANQMLATAKKHYYISSKYSQNYSLTK